MGVCGLLVVSFYDLDWFAGVSLDFVGICNCLLFGGYCLFWWDF